MPSLQSLPWSEPLDLAAGLMESDNDSHWVLLYSGTQTTYSGRFSYLAYNMKQCLQAADFSLLSKKLTADRPRFDNAWFGYLGYGIKDSLEEVLGDNPNWLSLPHLTMMQFSTIITFDHEERSVSMWSEYLAPRIPQAGNSATIYPTPVKNITSNMSKENYLEKVATIIKHIHAGDLYQANLTRKFGGHFTENPAPFALFRSLCNASPAPYSAFMRINDTYVLSSSPELFLGIDANGYIRTRPIKGTSARFADKALDQQSFDSLASSAKDKAENLMIVDLMRNDLSKSCTPGSITTTALFEVTSHANVHHMSSTIHGQKIPECSTLEAISHCFPPGSMTGAPKIKAMDLCSQMELLERGIYSGALGWLGGDGSCELSVVIRTLILQGQRFEFQVGGGIVADSTPAQELKETIDKSKGILACLGILAADIECL